MLGRLSGCIHNNPCARWYIADSLGVVPHYGLRIRIGDPCSLSNPVFVRVSFLGCRLWRPKETKAGGHNFRQHTESAGKRSRNTPNRVGPRLGHDILGVEITNTCGVGRDPYCQSGFLPFLGWLPSGWSKPRSILSQDLAPALQRLSAPQAAALLARLDAAAADEASSAAALRRLWRRVPQNLGPTNEAKGRQ